MPLLHVCVCHSTVNSSELLSRWMQVMKGDRPWTRGESLGFGVLLILKSHINPHSLKSFISEDIMSPRKNSSELYKRRLFGDLGMCQVVRVCKAGHKWFIFFHAKHSCAGGTCISPSLFHIRVVRLSTSEEATRLFHWCKSEVGVICSVLTPGAAGDSFFLRVGHPSLPNGSINKQLRLFRGTWEMLHTLSSLARQTTSEKDWLLQFGAGEINLLLFILPPSVHRTVISLSPISDGCDNNPPPVTENASLNPNTVSISPVSFFFLKPHLISHHFYDFLSFSSSAPCPPV